MTLNTIVLDLDGTLLNSSKTISPKTKEALIHLQTKGIRVILASGRPSSGMIDIARSLSMHRHHGRIIAFNGACALEMSTLEPIIEHFIEAPLAQKLLAHLENYLLIPMVSQDNRLYVNSVFNGMIHLGPHPKEDDPLFNIIEYEATGGHFLLQEVGSLAQHVNFPVYKVLVAGEPDYLHDQQSIMFGPFKDILHGSFSAPFYYEFTHPDADKAKTLRKLVMDPSTVIAFGDSQNDISLLQYAHVGIAMGNAADDVKRIADDITATNDEEGIYHSLLTYFPDLF